MAKRFSGVTKVEVDQEGTTSSLSDTIQDQNVLQDTEIEVEENSDDNDVTGASPHTGQFANVTLVFDDESVATTIKASRDPTDSGGYSGTAQEDRFAMWFYFPDGNGGNNIIKLDPVRGEGGIRRMSFPGESGRDNHWIFEGRGFVTGHIDFA